MRPGQSFSRQSIMLMHITVKASDKIVSLRPPRRISILLLLYGSSNGEQIPDAHLPVATSANKAMGGAKSERFDTYAITARILQKRDKAKRIEAESEEDATRLAISDRSVPTNINIQPISLRSPSQATASG